MMDVRTYVTMGLILVALNSFAVSKEWSLCRWRAEDPDSDFSYLVLLKCGLADEEELCSGSIISPSTVLSYCPCNGTDTKVYAGLLNVGNATETPEGDIQLRTVTKVDAHSNETDLKVYYVSEKWDLNEKVVSIKLHLDDKRRSSGESCQVLGFGGKDGAAHVMNQTIGSDHCGSEETMEDRLYSKGQALSERDRGGPAVCKGEQYGINVGVLKEDTPTGGSTTLATSSTTKNTSISDRIRSTYRGDDTCNTYVKIIFYSDWLRDKTSSGQSIHRYSKTISDNQVPAHRIFCRAAVGGVVLAANSAPVGCRPRRLACAAAMPRPRTAVVR